MYEKCFIFQLIKTEIYEKEHYSLILFNMERFSDAEKESKIMYMYTVRNDNEHDFFKRY